MTSSDEIPEWVGVPWLARHLGVTEQTVRDYVNQARRNLKNGTPKPGDIPLPDDPRGRTLGWKGLTIAAWQRPGRGAGGGRPWPSRKR